MNNQQWPCGIVEEFSAADAEIARRLLSLKRTPSFGLVERVRGIPTLSRERAGRMPHRAWGVVAAVLLLAVLVAASPSVRAAIYSLQETIGDVYLTITDRSLDTSNATIVEPELMSLEAARADMPFDFDIPRQLPDGWVMDEHVRVYDLGNGPFVEILYANPNEGGTGIHFSARSALQGARSPVGWLVAPDSFREIEIGGQPAVIVMGGWDHESQDWAGPGVITLIWTVAEVEYTLSTVGSEGSEAGLMAVAESTR